MFDEATRPSAPALEGSTETTAAGEAVAAHFRSVHERYRNEMRTVLDMLAQVRDSTDDIGAARGSLHELAIRSGEWALGGYCQAQCYSLTEHHTIEDDGIFPHLRRSQPSLAPVLDRLDAEHHVIHDLLDRIDAALVQLVQHPGEHAPITTLLDELSETILSHFAYEERELLAPLRQFGFFAGQVGPA